MTETKGQTWQDVNEAALAVIGTPARASTETIFGKINQHLDSPIRLYAAATPDSKLYFGASTVEVGDGGVKSIPPIEDSLVASAAGSLDFQQIAGMVSGITLTKEGGTYAHPVAAAAGQFVAGVFVRMADGTFNCKFTSIEASLAAAKAINLGPLFSALGGLICGYVYLESTDNAGRWKTAGSLTAVIENKTASGSTIGRFGAGGGGSGGGADQTYKLTAFSATGFTLKGGYARLDFKRILASGTGSTKATLGTDIAAVGATVLANSGLSFAADTILSLVIDMLAIGDKIQIDNKRTVYRWDASHLRLLTTVPEDIDPRRYFFLNEIYFPVGATDWSTSEYIANPGRSHDTNVTFFSVPQTQAIVLASVSLPQTVALTTFGKPQVVEVFYFDGTNEHPAGDESHIVSVSASQIVIDPAGRDLTGGKELRVHVVHFPAQMDMMALQNSRTLGPFTAADAATMAHGLANAGHHAVFWAVEEIISTGRKRELPIGALVQGWDDTNVYLDWAGLPFVDGGSNALQYWIKGGPVPHAASFPAEYGGFTKFVGRGPGSFATLTAALAASSPGDSILIMRGYAISAPEVVNKSDIKIQFMPGVKITTTNAAVARMLDVTADRVEVEGAAYDIDIVGGMTDGIRVSGVDCHITKTKIVAANTATAITNAYNIAATANRTLVEGSVRRVGAATVTNTLVDAGTDTDARVRG